ncbi:uncharacterized protein Dsimw501_GD28955 [Drosophila simulans]|uniref:MADF domain-containing protein n=1 Tax=Drosophila simulans TaxID=7240 RepID=A0A0J9RK93_DROSI|nr:uncharacterized protein Dsimw501_GD28955 [Drosophila simulans]
MDFIDDFIEEYKSNPCLWKGCRKTYSSSVLQRVFGTGATKHGEMYNVERTKQKINNLRCAFRHQLRKYNEVKKKGEKYEPYCPKRRYFESLMFLKDEEIPADKKCKREQSVCMDNSMQLGAPENGDEYSDAESLHKPPKPSADSIKMSPNNSANEFCANIFEEAAAAADPVISIKTVNNANSHASGATIKEVEIVVPANNRLLSARRKSVPDSIKSPPGDPESPQCKRVVAQNQTKLISNQSPSQKANHIIRKRSSSVSSQISEDNEPPPGKFRADISTIDFERLFSLALKSADSQLDDHFSNFGKIIAHKLRSMDGTQAIYAEKIIADVLYQGQMKMLSSLSIHQFMGVDNATVYLESHSK